MFDYYFFPHFLKKKEMLFLVPSVLNNTIMMRREKREKGDTKLLYGTTIMMRREKEIFLRYNHQENGKRDKFASNILLKKALEQY